MPYTINFLAIDLGGYYSAGLPILTGSIISPRLVGGSGAPFDTATSNTTTPSTLTFSSNAVPPTSACAVLVNDTSTSPVGDWIRSGVLSALPPSPATPSIITIQPVPISPAMVAAATAGAVLPPTIVPGWVRWLCGAVSAGAYIPLVAFLPPPTVTLGTGSITVTVTGRLSVRTFYFSVTTSTFTLSTTLTPAPSGDPEVPSRILSMTVTGPSRLSAMSAFPGLGLFLSSVVASQVESLVNATILARGQAAASALGWQLTPTAVISARKVTVLPSGITLQPIVGNLWGPAVVPILGTLAVSIAPQAQAGIPRSYTVTVRDAVTGNPVPMATVTLHNYDANGVAVVSTWTTDAAGQAVLNVTLHSRTFTTFITSTYLDDRGKPHRERERVTKTVSSTLTVDAVRYNSVQLVLL